MLTPQDITLLQQGQHPEPFAVLGMHQTPGGLCVRVFLPAVLSVELLAANSRDVAALPLAQLQRQGDSDLFVWQGTERERFDYRLRVRRAGAPGQGVQQELIDDPYRFPLLLGQTIGDVRHFGKHRCSRRVASGVFNHRNLDESFVADSLHSPPPLPVQAVERPVQAEGRNCLAPRAMKKVAKCAEWATQAKP